MSFDKIAVNLLESQGYEVLECASDQEATDRAEALKAGSRQYPVHFSVSDTSGEKAYEEEVDSERFAALGVVTGKGIPDRGKIESLFDRLNTSFEGNVTKEEVVSILQDYLPNFEHIEKGKSLDSKM